MPELPEVETIACGLRPQLTGRRIVSVAVRNEGTVQGDAATFARCVPGRVIAGVRRRGKLLLMELAPSDGSGGTGGDRAPHLLGVHLKMTGRLFVYGPEVAPNAHTRVVFGLDDGNRLFFDDARKFGYVRALSDADLSTWDFWRSLGPEPLELAAPDFVELFRGRRGRIKALLLDQTVIAGIGNIYADESLFRAGIRPDAQAGGLSPDRLRVLHGHLVDVLRESIAECGSSIRDYRDAHGDAGAFQNRFRVYGRGGQPCVACGRALATGKVAGRTTVYCEGCQKPV
ncbi:bifunctional DNA-formamidopyrimidine glycosylase/DNA-(apurinic or apyrimidinic site) lyase [Nitratidesulfovibrio sp. D1]|uniref:bifunctional DNA-formamidopyrimidine glycosylase/DNA-(apurinic or apyrimidinic site) lyase n=1 Tax=Nitratidesulfovibrio sp. D1 TaxID=3440151 RepID=UPI003EB9B3B2